MFSSPVFWLLVAFPVAGGIACLAAAVRLWNRTHADRSRMIAVVIGSLVCIAFGVLLFGVFLIAGCC